MVWYVINLLLIMLLSAILIMVAYSIAGEIGVNNGGFQHNQGESFISYDILEFRLNVCIHISF